jgi:hypothetical protein
VLKLFQLKLFQTVTEDGTLGRVTAAGHCCSSVEHLVAGLPVFPRQFRYWEKRCAPNAKPAMLFGNFKNCSLQKESEGQFLGKIYNEGAGKPFFGFYVYFRYV